MIQIDGSKRHVYIKCTEDSMDKILQATGGQKEYKHETGEITQVAIEIAGLGIKKFRIANLPPETKEHDIKASLSKYGEVRSIREETWASVYRYKVYNGILNAEMRLKMHLPSHMTIAGNDALLSYDGQPPTCYKCNQTGHQRQDCPRGRRILPHNITQESNTWADIVSNTTQEKRNTGITPTNNIPRGEETIKRPNTSPDRDQDRKRPQKPQNEQGGEDEKRIDKSEANNNQNENSVPGFEDEQMITLEEGDTVGGKHGLDSERVKVTEKNANRDTDYENKPEDDEYFAGQNSEASLSEATQPTDENTSQQTLFTRTKKLKTDKEENTFKIRNRSKTRNKNART